MAGINNNLMALGVQRQLQAAGLEAARASQRLSSGLRVSAAKDDAAGLAVASRLDVNVRAAATLSRGVMDGISLVQTAEGGLSQIQQALQRARELAVQAANGTLTGADRVALDAEYQQLLGHVDQVAKATANFGTHLLMGAQTAGSTPSMVDLFGSTSGSTVTLASGIKPVAFIPNGARNVTLTINSYSADDDLQLFSRQGAHLLGTPLSDNVWASNGVADAVGLTAKTLLPANGFTANATYQGPPTASGDGGFSPAGAALSLGYNGMTIGYSGDGDYQDSAANVCVR